MDGRTLPRWERIRRAGKYQYDSRKPSTITVCITLAINVIQEALKNKSNLSISLTIRLYGKRQKK